MMLSEEFDLSGEIVTLFRGGDASVTEDMFGRRGGRDAEEGFEIGTVVEVLATGRTDGTNFTRIGPTAEEVGAEIGEFLSLGG